MVLIKSLRHNLLLIKYADLKYHVWWGGECVHLFSSTHSSCGCPLHPVQAHPASWQSTHPCFFPSPPSYASTALTSVPVTIRAAGFRILCKWNSTVYILLHHSHNGFEIYLHYLCNLFMIYVGLSTLLKLLLNYWVVIHTTICSLICDEHSGCFQSGAVTNKAVVHVHVHFFLYFWRHWVFVAAHGFFSSVAHGLLFAVASLLVKHRLQACTGFSTCTMWAQLVTPGLSCSSACGVFPDQESNPHALHWQVVLNHWATWEVSTHIYWGRYMVSFLWDTYPEVQWLNHGIGKHLTV